MLKTSKDKEKAIRLFEFLKELSQLRENQVRNISDYQEVLWVSEIPQLRGAFFIGWDKMTEKDHPELWIEVRKPERRPCPEPPETLKAFANLKRLGDSHLESSFEALVKPLSAFDGTEQTWKRYSDEMWLPWAKEDRILKSVEEIYQKLFYIYQQQENLGESLETVFSLGFLSWRSPTGYEVRRHLLTAKAKLSFDATNGVISVAPAFDDSLFSLEQDAIDPEHRPAIETEQLLNDQLKQYGNARWNYDFICSVLKAWANSISAESQFVPSLEKQKHVGTAPLIHLAPALILRKQTEKNLLKFYNSIIEQIKLQNSVSEGVQTLISTKSMGAKIGSDRSGTTKEPIYFPLPANDEQMEIASRIRSQVGLLVQGPPGTGKSHSIANLVSHLLATGNRVLVTSHTPRALKVLKDKIPASISKLCVQLLDSDLDALKGLEVSVQEIIQRSVQWSVQANAKIVAKYEEQLSALEHEERTLFERMEEKRREETKVYPSKFHFREGTLLDIGRQLREEEKHFGWFKDAVLETQPPEMTNHQALDLLKTIRWLNPARLTELNKLSVKWESMPEPALFGALVEEEKKVVSEHASQKGFEASPLFKLCEKVSPTERHQLQEYLSTILSQYQFLSENINSWVNRIAKDITEGREAVWKDLYNTTLKHLTALAECDRSVFELKPSGFPKKNVRTLRTDAARRLEHFQKGGKAGVPLFRSKVIKETQYLRKVKIDGVPCSDLGALRKLTSWLTIQEHLKLLAEAWKNFAPAPEGPLSQRIARFEDLLLPLTSGVSLVEKLQQFRGRIQLSQQLKAWHWNSVQDLQVFSQILQILKARDLIRTKTWQFDNLQRKLQEASLAFGAHPSTKTLMDAVAQRDVKLYEQAFLEIRRLDTDKKKYKEINTLLTSLKAKVPHFVSDLENSIRDPEWDTRLTNFTDAWNWARMNAWFQGVSDPSEVQNQFERLRVIREEMSEILEQLATEKAWKACFERMTEDQRQHLIAWEKAIQRFGKGTGKHAENYRKEAREHMDHCRGAIPSWIMPIHRVLEIVKPGKDQFDVVIIDEASQSGPDALFLFELGKKVIIVGDDKQIAPESIGISREQVDQLRKRYLYDIPCNDAIGLDNSLFDFAEIKFGGRIRLREHFRCVPEIIGFSNMLCYRSAPLIPLREKEANPLKPAVEPVFVQNGIQTEAQASTINVNEAKSIVARIKEAVDDPAYEGKSMGVISLLGDAQANLISKLLISQIGPKEIEKRKILCGDAYAFQGDERDVVFLSMVSAPNRGQQVGVLANAKAERRFNVAMSRARDQVLLYHSAELKDLSQKCLRSQLLRYFLSPQSPSELQEVIDVGRLQTALAKRTANSKPPRPFRSWFELEVFLKVKEAGYDVVPEYKISDYSLDLVIQTRAGRVAIECAEQNAEQEADPLKVKQQRDLQRCGWRFWRLTEALFYRNPNASLAPLWELIEDSQKEKATKLKVVKGEAKVVLRTTHSEKLAA